MQCNNQKVLFAYLEILLQCFSQRSLCEIETPCSWPSTDLRVLPKTVYWKVLVLCSSVIRRMAYLQILQSTNHSDSVKILLEDVMVIDRIDLFVHICVVGVHIHV